MDIDKKCVLKCDKNGETPLHYAAEAGHFGTAAAIVDRALDDTNLTE